MTKADQHNQVAITAQDPMHLGMLARRRGDRRAALAHFVDAAAADPAGIRPRVEIARELLDLGRPYDAEAMLLGVLEDVPDQPQAHALLAHLGRPVRGAEQSRRRAPPGGHPFQSRLRRGVIASVREAALQAMR